MENKVAFKKKSLMSSGVIFYKKFFGKKILIKFIILQQRNFAKLVFFINLE